MLLIILFLCLFIVSIIFTIYKYKKDNEFNSICLLTTIITKNVLILMLTLVIVVKVQEKANKEAFQKRYEALVYQLENNLYDNDNDNDNDIGKRELYYEIERWNYDLAYRKAMQNNLWVGIFYEQIYDDFEFINLS